jgi:SAM-dependent methyltransferase
MKDYDYSLYYANWHDNSPEHRAKVSARKAEQIRPHLKLPTDARILDVGCGFGFALGALRRLGYHNIAGLEQSPQQADICRRAGFEVAVTDDTAAWLNARPNQFDAVLLFDVLEHVPVDMQINFLRAIYACLRIGGVLLLTVPNANAILAARWRYNDYTHFSSFTEHSLSFVLQNAKFERPWIDNNKGIGRFPRRIWLRQSWPSMRKWLVRWCWLQVFKAEQGYEPIENICFDLNLTAIAKKEA